MTEPIWSTGGVGGERAVTEDLEWALGALRAAVDDVGTAQLELARRRAALELGLDATPGNGVGQAAAIAELAHAACARAPALRDRLEDVERRLRGVVAAYVDAERSARHRVGLVEAVTQRVADGEASAIWLARVAAAGVALATPVGAGLVATGHRGVVDAVLPDTTPPTTGIVDRDACEALAASPIAAQVTVSLALVLFALEHLTLEPWRRVGSSHTWHGATTTSVEDAMRRLRLTELAGGGAIRIERWTSPDGVTHRIVYIPGTQDWGFWSANPSDLDADAWLLLGGLPDAAHLVEAALAADGTQPGEPVMLVGHSLGGIIATALAGNADFRSRFSVKAVLTAGSPTGRIALPATVQAMHLEGTRDLVPGLDGRPNPDTPTRVTVHHDARDSELPELSGEGATSGSAHSLDTYAQTARLVDEGLSASTDAWLDAESDFFEPGRDAVVTEYRP